MSNSTYNADYQLLLTLLREFRDRKELTQVALADRLGTTQGFVSKCERGSRRVDLVEAVEIAEGMGVSPMELLNEYLERRRKAGAHPKIRRKRRNYKR